MKPEVLIELYIVIRYNRYILYIHWPLTITHTRVTIKNGIPTILQY